jgi:hypothetical protein
MSAKMVELVRFNSNRDEKVSRGFPPSLNSAIDFAAFNLIPSVSLPLFTLFRVIVHVFAMFYYWPF